MTRADLIPIVKPLIGTVLAVATATWFGLGAWGLVTVQQLSINVARQTVLIEVLGEKIDAINARQPARVLERAGR